MENNALTFSIEGLRSRVAFYDGLNDINVFVEDRDSQYLYETIFHRLLGEQYKIKSIFPCGSKQEVINSFKEYGEKTGGTKNIYLVDGDFDSFLFPDKMVDNENFIYLKKYNIESYLINESGANSIIKCKLKIVDKDVKKYFSFSTWKETIIDQAKELFLCYCYLQKNSPGVVNVGRSCYEFIDRETGYKRSDGNFEKYRQSIFDNYPGSEKEIASLRGNFEERFGNNYEPIICGKFLMASLFSLLRKITRSRIDNDVAFWRMVETFNVSELDFVKKACLGY